MEMTEYRPHPSPGSHTDEEFAYPGADDGESPTAMAWHYLRVLRRHCWKILGFVLAVVAATLLYALQLTPLYESTALIELANLNPMTRLGSDMVSYNIRIGVCTSLPTTPHLVVGRSACRVGVRPSLNRSWAQRSRPVVQAGRRAFPGDESVVD